MNSELTRFLAAKSPISLVDHVIHRVEAADLHLFSSLFFLEKPFSPFQRSFRFLEQLLAEVLFAQADDHFHQTGAEEFVSICQTRSGSCVEEGEVSRLLLGTVVSPRNFREKLAIQSVTIIDG